MLVYYAGDALSAGVYGAYVGAEVVEFRDRRSLVCVLQLKWSFDGEVGSLR